MNTDRYTLLRDCYDFLHKLEDSKFVDPRRWSEHRDDIEDYNKRVDQVIGAIKSVIGPWLGNKREN